MVATHAKRLKHSMVCVTDTYSRDMINLIFFFFNFALEYESSERLAFLLFIYLFIYLFIFFWGEGVLGSYCECSLGKVQVVFLEESHLRQRCANRLLDQLLLHSDIQR